MGNSAAKGFGSKRSFGSCQYTRSDPSAPSNVQKDIYNFSEND